MNLSQKSTAIKEMLDFNTVAAAYGLDFNRAGFARCPFHNEKTASFKIKNQRVAHCFGCGWSGDVISFTGKLFNLDFRQSVRKLITDFNLPIVVDRKMNLSENSEALMAYNAIIAENNKRKQAEKAASERFQARLWTYATLDKWKRECAPISPCDAFDERYVIACKELDEAAYNLLLSS